MAQESNGSSSPQPRVTFERVLAVIAIAISVLTASLQIADRIRIANVEHRQAQNQSLLNASAVKLFKIDRVLSSTGHTWWEYELTVANYSPQPIRDLELFMSESGDEDHDAMPSSSAVYLQDVKSCESLEYVIRFEVGKDRGDSMEPSPSLIYRLDDIYWSQNFQVNRTTEMTNVQVSNALDRILGRPIEARGWSDEDVKVGNLHGPGCP